MSAKGASINDVRARGGEVGSGKVDKLRDHIREREGGVQKPEIFTDVIDVSFQRL